jgi:arabinofuranosyltransferase
MVDRSLPGQPLSNPRPFEWVAVCLAVLATRLAGLYSLSLFDDAFITFRHSAHLAAGHGLVFNVGDRVLGTTSPLFALLLALPAAALGIAPELSSLVLGIGCDLVTAILAYGLLRREFGRGVATAFLTLYAVDPHLIRIAVGGMESGPFVLAAFGVVLLLSRKREGAATILSAAAVYLRPESVLLLLISAARLWIRRPRTRAVATTGLSMLILLLPLGLFAAYYGSVLPQSVASKAHLSDGSLIEVARHFFFPGPGPLQTILTILALMGLRECWSRSAALRWLLIWTGGYAAAYLVARPHMWTWYALPVYFAKVVISGVFLGGIVERVAGGRFRLLRSAWAAVTASAAVALALVVWAGASPARRHVYEPLADWCRKNVRAGDTIAASDVGAVGYYSKGFVYDLAGLVWSERWKYGVAREVILAKHPDFIFAQTCSDWDELYARETELGRMYEPVHRFSPSGSQVVHLEPAQLAPGWVQDYVMFRRVR